jgi:sulfide:quinone oxidoreductase
MTIDYRWLTPKIAVTGQLSATDMREAHEAGFRSIICNRPDGEEGPSQPSQNEVLKTAKALGLEVAYHPVNSVGHTPEQALEMGRLLNSLPTPILSYCRSGARCATLIALAAQLGQPVPQ